MTNEALMGGAVAELLTGILNDPRVQEAKDESGWISVIGEYTRKVADRHGLNRETLAGEMLRMMDGPTDGPVDLSPLAAVGGIVDGSPLDPEAAARLGYPNMLAAITVCNEPRVDLAIAKVGGKATPWAVIEHVGSDPFNSDEGFADARCVRTLNEALSLYVSSIERYGMAPSLRM